MGVLNKIKEYEAIMADRTISPSEKVVLFDIHRRCYGDKTSCFPSVESISSITGISQRNVRRNISTLESKGKIKKDHRNGSSNVYHLVPYPGHIVTHDNLSPLTDCHTPPANLAYPPLPICHPNTSNINTTKDNTLGNSTAVAAPPPKKKNTDPRIKEVLNYFFDTYKEKLGENPHIIGGRDTAVIKRLLRTYKTSEELKGRIDSYLSDPMEWMETPQYSLPGFEKRVHIYTEKNRKAKESGLPLWALNALENESW